MRGCRPTSRAVAEASFIHLIRDGRDVALSQRERVIDDEDVTMGAMAERWQRRIAAAREGADEVKPGIYLEVRYEDLVGDTEATLRRICEFIGLEFDAAMLDYHRRAGDRLPARQTEPPRAHN